MPTTPFHSELSFSITTQMVDFLRNTDNEAYRTKSAEFEKVDRRNQVNLRTSGMTTYLWRKYADYLHTKWEKEVLWTMVDPYKRPKSFTPLVKIYVCAFYTGVIGAAITEQLYKRSDYIPLRKII
ncbi:embryo defective protein [Tanacetum coccineum]